MLISNGNFAGILIKNIYCNIALESKLVHSLKASYICNFDLRGIETQTKNKLALLIIASIRWTNIKFLQTCHDVSRFFFVISSGSFSNNFSTNFNIETIISDAIRHCTFTARQTIIIHYIDNATSELYVHIIVFQFHFLHLALASSFVARDRIIGNTFRM